MDIAQLVEQQPAQHVMAAIAATVHIHHHTPRLTPYREAARAAGAAGAGPAEV